MTPSSSNNSVVQTVLDLLGEYVDSIDFSTPKGKARNDEATDELCQKLRQGVPYKTAFATLEIVFKINKLKNRMEDSISQRKDELVEKYEKTIAVKEEKANENSRRWIGSLIVVGTLVVVLIAGICRLYLGDVSNDDCLYLFLLVSIPCAIWYVIVKDPALIDRFMGLWRRSEREDDAK